MADIKIDAASIENIPNDTDLPAAIVVKALQGEEGVTLRYGDIVLMVRRADYEAIQKQVAERNREQRRAVMISVESALEDALPRIKDNSATKLGYDQFYGDLMIWNALKSGQS